MKIFRVVSSRSNPFNVNKRVIHLCFGFTSILPAVINSLKTLGDSTFFCVSSGLAAAAQKSILSLKCHISVGNTMSSVKN